MSVISGLQSRYLVTAEPQRTERRLELVFVAFLFVVLLQLLAWMWDRIGGASVAAVLPAKDSLRVIDAGVSGAVTAAQSVEVQSRPLFWASRRPSGDVGPKNARPTGKPARGLEGLQVAGAVGAGDQGKAIVIYKEKLMRLGIGDKVAGWTLQSVSLGQVVFVSATARDVRRLSPLPIVAAAAQEEPVNRAPRVDGAVTATPGAVDAAAVANIPPKNNKKEASLSLGG